MNSKVICLDFDNVLYDGSQGYQEELTNAPVEKALEAVRILSEGGYEVVVQTTRDDLQKVLVWLNKNGFLKYILVEKVTNKKPVARAYVDDRAVRFTNWNDVLRYFV